VFEWRCQDITPPSSTRYDEVHVAMFKDIEEMSGGRLKITNFPSGALCPDVDNFESCATGLFEVGISSPGYHRSLIPEIEAINLPMGLRNLDDACMVSYKLGLLDFFRESYAPHGLHLLDIPACRGVFILSTIPIRRAADFEGMKVRTHTTYASWVENMGASTVFIPGAEVYTGLAAGTADAATWGCEATLRDFGWYEVAKYLMHPAALLAMLSYDTYVNMDAWNSLPDDLKAILHARVGKPYSVDNYLWDTHESVLAMEEMTAAGLEVVTIPDEDYPILIEAAEKVWTSVAEKAPRAKQTIKLITDYMRTQGYTDYKIE